MSELGQPGTALVCQRHVERIRSFREFGSEERARKEEASALASEASALPALPDGSTLVLAIGTLADCDTGGQLWSSAPVLCRWMAERPDEIAGSAVIELGCGTGAVGLFAAALGARRVLLTNGGPPAVLELARTNMQANAHLRAADAHVLAMPLEWGGAATALAAASAASSVAPSAASPAASSAASSAVEEAVQAEVGMAEEGQAAQLVHSFDWVVGSDVSYSAGAHAPLFVTLKELLTSSGAGGNAAGRREGGAAGRCRVILAHEHRVA